MDDFKDKQKIQQVFDHALYGIREDPWMAQRVLNIAHGKEKKVVKKKVSVAFVLILIVLMSTVAALAWTLSRQYFEDVAQLQASGGYYDDWGVEDKQRMVRILLEHGLIDEQEAAALNTEEEMDAFMLKLYGIDEKSDTIGLWAILEKEMGPVSSWSLEDRAWYTEMQKAAGLQSDVTDEAVYAVPEAENIQPDEAIAIAQNAIIETFRLDDHALDQHQIEIYFQSYPDDEYKEMHYDISFRGETYADFYSCSVTKDGQIMDHSMGESYDSPAESVKKKQQFLLENDLEISALFSEYAQEHIDGDLGFAFWPLEDKRNVTDMLRPVILENMAETPGYSDQTKIFWATHFYGMPDERAISQEKAVGIAREQLTSTFGLTAKQTLLFDKIGVFYEVTDPVAPLWKINLRIGEQREGAAVEGLSLNVNYRVVINAYTGQVLEKHSFTEVHDDIAEEVALIN